MSGNESTLNGFGVMMRNQEHDPFVQGWLKACVELPARTAALEVGCAFGAATLLALGRGATCDFIANDLADDHLDEVWRRAEESVSGDALARLHTIQGRVPDVLLDAAAWRQRCPVPVHAVLAANVFHFLSGEEVTATARALHDMCAPGARLFVSVDSPWTRYFQPLWREYKLRKLLRRPNPGQAVIDSSFSENSLVPHRLRAMDTYHVMEPPALTALLEAGGWTVTNARTFSGDAAGNPEGVSLDGREMTGAQAVKL